MHSKSALLRFNKLLLGLIKALLINETFLKLVCFYLLIISFLNVEGGGRLQSYVDPLNYNY